MQRSLEAVKTVVGQQLGATSVGTACLVQKDRHDEQLCGCCQDPQVFRLFPRVMLSPVVGIQELACPIGRVADELSEWGACVSCEDSGCAS